MFLTQRPNLVNESILGEATETVVLGLRGGNEIEKLTHYGFNAMEILALPPYDFIAQTDAGGELRGRVTI